MLSPGIVHSADRDAMTTDTINRGLRLFIPEPLLSSISIAAHEAMTAIKNEFSPQPVPHNMAGKMERGHSYIVHRTNAGSHQ